MKRVLVTGGAGYVGSHTVKALVASGVEPVIFDNFSTGHRWAAQRGKIVEGDLEDASAIKSALKDHQIEGVVHFAASIAVGESVANPQKYFWNNVVNTLKLLDAMLACDVKTIVFSSSAAVYGNPHQVPIPEDHPLQSTSPYGETKLMMEQILRWYGGAYGFRWAALRYFNAAGADRDGELGEQHDPESHLIPLIIKAALGQIPQVQIFGTDYDTEDGTAVRDYIHVTDLADAHVRALNYLESGKQSVSLNLGTGRGHSVREVVATVERVSKTKVPFREAPRRAGDPPILVADASRAAQLLQWKPQFSELESIVADAWKWHSARAQSPK